MQTSIRRVTAGLCQCCVLLVLPLLFACSPKLSESKVQNQMTLVSADSIMTFHVWNSTGRIKPRQENRYHYYIRNSLQSMQGAFIGKPLHGQYTLVNRKNTILEQGNFKKGMKSGKWTTWYLNGSIHSMITWKEGRKAGKYWIYNDDTKLQQTGTYQADVLDGKMTTYSYTGEKSYQYYDKGILRQPKPAKNKEEKARSRKAKTEAVKPEAVKDETKKNLSGVKEKEAKKDKKKAKEEKSTTEPTTPSVEKRKKKPAEKTPNLETGTVKPVSPPTAPVEEKKPSKASRKPRKTSASKSGQP